MFRITSNIALPDRDVDERFVPRGASRPRKRAREVSGVELRLDILSASLPEDVKTRLLALHDRRVTSEGVLVVASRTRASQEQNREAARTRLIGIIREAASPSPERRPTAAPAVLRPARETGRSHSALSRAVKGDPG
jgi:ribosome-associated protein